MREITEQNYKNLEYNFEGIVVAYPKVDLYFNAEFYFIKQKIDYETDKRYYTMSGYNGEDCTCNGISFDGFETRIENVFNCFSQMNYYQFDDMKEFCEWYIHKDDKLNESIDKFIKETKEFEEKQNFHTVELDSILGTSFADNLKENIEKKKKVTYFEQKYGFNPYEKEAPEELCYWEIYNDENCDNELKGIIEKKFPEIKELSQNKNHRTIKSCSNLKELEGELKLFSSEEIRDIMNPGWNTRRAKLHDVLKLLELRDIRQNTLNMIGNTKEISLKESLAEQLKRDEQRIEDFLNEEVL